MYPNLEKRLVILAEARLARGATLGDNVRRVKYREEVLYHFGWLWVRSQHRTPYGTARRAFQPCNAVFDNETVHMTIVVTVKDR